MALGDNVTNSQLADMANAPYYESPTPPAAPAPAPAPPVGLAQAAETPNPGGVFSNPVSGTSIPAAQSQYDQAQSPWVGVAKRLFAGEPGRDLGALPALQETPGAVDTNAPVTANAGNTIPSAAAPQGSPGARGGDASLKNYLLSHPDARGASVSPTGGGGGGGPAKPKGPSAFQEVLNGYGTLAGNQLSLGQAKINQNNAVAKGEEDLGTAGENDVRAKEARTMQAYAQSSKDLMDYANQSEQAAKFRLQPERYMHDANALKKGLMVFSTMLGGVGSMFNGKPNAANEQLQKMIERDIDAQKNAYEVSRARGQDLHNLYSMNLKALGDKNAALDASDQMARQAFVHHINSNVQATNNPILVAEAKNAGDQVMQTSRLANLARSDAAAAAAAKGKGSKTDKMVELLVNGLNKGQNPIGIDDLARIRQVAQVLSGEASAKEGSMPVKASPHAGKPDQALEQRNQTGARAEATLKELKDLEDSIGWRPPTPSEQARLNVLRPAARVALAASDSSRGTPSTVAEKASERMIPDRGWLPTDILGTQRTAVKEALEATKKRDAIQPAPAPGAPAPPPGEPDVHPADEDEE